MMLTQQMITIGLCALGTMATRFLPFLIFSPKKPTTLTGVILSNKQKKRFPPYQM